MSRPSTTALRVAALFVGLLGCGSASAHKLKLFATVEGAAIRGYAYFPGGGRARDVKVWVLDPADAKLGETRTDENGDFAFEAKVRCDHRFVAETADGHRAVFLVEAAELPDTLPPTPAADRPGAEPAEPTKRVEERPASGTSAPPGPQLASLVEQAVSRQVRPLREQLEAYEERRRLQDILGGIGYIVGIAGIVFYFLGARRGKQRPSRPD